MRFSWTGLNSGAFVGAANVLRSDAEFSSDERLGTVAVPDPVGPELCRLLRHDDIPLPALAVSAFLVTTDDGLKGLPAGLGPGHGGVCAADIVGMEE
jgi:hypothetical protein